MFCASHDISLSGSNLRDSTYKVLSHPKHQEEKRKGSSITGKQAE